MTMDADDVFVDTGPKPPTRPTRDVSATGQRITGVPTAGELPDLGETIDRVFEPILQLMKEGRLDEGLSLWAGAQRAQLLRSVGR